ncbi:MAG: hypothetical protein ACRD0A_03800 [Acidimicrobiales bacterium]
MAISGGGHRATVWGWGALLALVDMGSNADVVSIASVSGGSIASGVVANAGDYAGMSPSAYEDALRPGLRVAARDGLFFFGPATNGYLARLFTFVGLAFASLVGLVIAAVGTGRDWPLGWFLLLSLATLVVAGRPVLKSRLGPRWKALFVALLLAVGPLTVAWLAITRGLHGWAILWLLVPVAVTAALLWMAARVFARRSEAVEQALGADLLARDGRATRLAEVDGRVHHVFCTAELQAGDHCYFTPRLVYCYRAGAGRPDDFTLAAAVQASACLPGAFLPRELETGRFGMVRPWTVLGDEPPAVPERLVVNDGGVYDNMADHWELGFDGDRVARLRQLPWLGDRPVQERADTLIVANAGKALGWQRLARASWLGREVRGLGRTVDILYDVSTSQRRVALVDRFSGRGRRKVAGALVHVAQSPFTVPTAYGRGEGERADRAREALALLEGLGADRDDWRGRANASAGVGTVLRALGVDVTADLMLHAYWLTRVNCYVMLGLGRLDDPASFARDRFVALARG